MWPVILKTNSRNKKIGSGEFIEHFLSNTLKYRNLNKVTYFVLKYLQISTKWKQNFDKDHKSPDNGAIKDWNW